MASNTHLTELHASSHPLGPHTAALVADMLAVNTGLRSLCIGDSSLGDEGVAALAAGIAKCRLSRLDLAAKGLGPRGAQALAGALATAASLSHLILSSNAQLADAGLQALCGQGGAGPGAGSPDDSPSPWAGLRVLELQGCGITAEGVRALAASPGCGGLEELWLDGNPLGPQGGQALRGLLQAASQLRELHLRGTDLGDEGGRALAEGLAACSRDGGRLGHLDLADCGLRSQAVAALGAAFTAGARLEFLNLAGNGGIAEADTAALGAGLAAREAPAVAHLDLSGTQAAAQTVNALSRAPGLRHLSLVGCPLASPGATALASSLGSGGWAGLQELCISGCGMGVADVSSVFIALAGGGAPGLKSLEVGANPATQDDSFPSLLDTLRASRPDLAVYWRSGDDPAPVVK